MYLRLTTFTKTLHKCSLTYLFCYFYFALALSPPMTLLTAGALTALPNPQLIATASNVCTTDAWPPTKFICKIPNVVFALLVMLLMCLFHYGSLHGAMPILLQCSCKLKQTKRIAGEGWHTDSLIFLKCVSCFKDHAH